MRKEHIVHYNTETYFEYYIEENNNNKKLKLPILLYILLYILLFVIMGIIVFSIPALNGVESITILSLSTFLMSLFPIYKFILEKYEE